MIVKQSLSSLPLLTRVLSAQGDAHGCPYKTLDPEGLRAALGRLRVTGAAAEEAVGKARAGHFQLACAAAFAGAHGGCQCDTGINHPNQVCNVSTLNQARQPGWNISRHHAPASWMRNKSPALRD